MKEIIVKNCTSYNFFNDPKKVIRFCVLFGCSIAVIYQVWLYLLEHGKKLEYSVLYILDISKWGKSY